MTASMLAEIAKEKIRMFHLVEFYFDSGTTYVSMSYKDISWNGNTYLATGSLLKISDISEEVGLKVGAVSIKLSGVNQANIATALSEDYTDRQVKVYRGLLSEGHLVVADPMLLFDGRIDNFSLSEDIENGTSILTWQVPSHWADFEKRSGRRCNMEDQQLHFPDDKGFDFASEIVKDLKWGRI